MTGKPCCCPGCKTFADGFDRANSTNLGGNWNECVGDWSIASNRLSVSSANAIAVIVDWPWLRAYGVVDLHDLSEGRVYRLIAGYGTALDPCNDGQTSLIAEYDIIGGGEAVLRLIKSVAGAESILESEVQNVPGQGPVNLQLCIGLARVNAATNDSVYSLTACAAPTGYYWALGTGDGSGEHLFDDLEIIEHYSLNVKCPMCECGCEGKCLPKTLRYTFVNNTYCEQLDGVTGIITGGSGQCFWISDEITGVCIAPVNDSLQVKLQPVTDIPSEYSPAHPDVWEVELWRYVSQTIFDVAHGTEEESTCDPLYLKFGPFQIAGNPDSDDLCCEGDWVYDPDPVGYWGDFWIIITEV